MIIISIAKNTNFSSLNFIDCTDVKVYFNTNNRRSDMQARRGRSANPQSNFTTIKIKKTTHRKLREMAWKMDMTLGDAADYAVEMAHKKMKE